MKKIGCSIGVIFCVVGIVCIYWLLGNWTIRFHSKLDTFFGEGNWEVVSEDTDNSRVYAVRNNSSWNTYGDGRPRLWYRNWNILATNSDGQEEVWQISNLAYNMNRERYKIYSSKRYRARQALTLELMEISFSAVEEEVHKEIIREGLTEEEAYCIYVDMSYNDGNPSRGFYDKLAREPWFTLEGVTAENYLASDLYDFYLLIRIHDYRLEQLTKQEQENVVNSLENIEKRLLEKYGEHASFQILYNEYNVEYADGLKQ